MKKRNREVLTLIWNLSKCTIIKQKWANKEKNGKEGEV